MAKPPPARIGTDDFEVIVGGQAYHPHEGEWVEMYLDQTVEEMNAGEALARIAVELEAAKGDKDEQLKVAVLASEHFDLLCDSLADRIIDWSWTDRRGRSLPKPDGTSGPIAKLSNDEVAYLLKLKESKRETEAERKNG